MTEEEAKRRFAEARVARLATVTPADEPHLVPICFAVDQEADTIYSAVDAKPKTTPDLKRLRNIDAHPHVTVLVDYYDDEWARVWWVRVDGTAAVQNRNDHGRRLLAAKYPQYAGAGADAQLGRMVVIRATKWTSWAYTDPV